MEPVIEEGDPNIGVGNGREENQSSHHNIVEIDKGK